MSDAWAIMATGFGIGLGVAMPIGPVNIEIIRRGLRSGYREAFPLGMGAVTADAVYLALVCLGVAHLVQYAAVRTVLLAMGVVMLEALGLMAIRDALRWKGVPREILGGQSDASDRLGASASPLRCYTIGLAMMAGNPLSMAAWLSFSSVVGNSAAANPWAYLWLAVSVPVGCASWVVFITTVLHFGRRFVSLAALRAVNIFGGLMLCGFGARLLWQAIH
ncbi:MAG: LysE family translocator [Candidatus Sumerlaeia bacterium]|nr:LysE family translocator [Candidatus Sumerlaeia bacterium]